MADVTMTASDGNARRGPVSSRARVVRSAQRHSRAVRVLRVVLPLSCVLLLGGVVGSIMFDPRVLLAVQLDAESMGISGSKIIMKRPRFTGYGDDATAASKGYEVTAARAEQNVGKPNEVDLFDLKAKVGIRETGRAELVAESGHLDNSTEVLDLFQAIELTTDLGEKANLTEARIDFSAGEITSKKPVTIKFTNAHLVADTMDLLESGDVAVFTGKVAMVLYPDPAAPVVAPPKAGHIK